MEGLDRSVKDFEPHLALHGGDDGLDFYRAIAENYKMALNPGGYLCFEFGEEQGNDVCDILTANGFTIRRRVNDFNGTERAVIAQYCVEE
jgi:release factor glutamine methyltransferase